MAKEIKKTMVDALAFITEHGNMSKENLELFTTNYCIAKSGGSKGPRELTILRAGSSVEDEILGRKCTITHKFFTIDRFSKNTSCIKEADAVKLKRYNESKKMEKAAQSLLAEARDITDVAEKVAKFEEYDAALAEATEYRKADFDVEFEGGFDTIEDLAASLGVEVIAPVVTK